MKVTYSEAIIRSNPPLFQAAFSCESDKYVYTSIKQIDSTGAVARHGQTVNGRECHYGDSKYTDRIFDELHAVFLQNDKLVKEDAIKVIAEYMAFSPRYTPGNHNQIRDNIKDIDIR